MKTSILVYSKVHHNEISEWGEREDVKKLLKKTNGQNVKEVE